ncbi:MAG: AEC family transporter [Bacteroidales bacterium]|nr:AEC family transporter [Bacteroidales bacterium]
MEKILTEILPVILLFVLGFLLKSVKVFKKDNGDFLLKLVFNIALPALVILSISKSQLTYEFLFLPFISVTIIVVSFIIARVIARFLKLESKTLGTFLIGAMILNIGFMLPFIIAGYGEEGLARIIIFDVGNGIMVFTFVYFQACRHGSHSGHPKTVLGKFFKAPPVWGIITGLMLNFFNIEIPLIAYNFLKIAGDLTIPLLMLSVGIFFEPRLVKLPALVSVIAIRMGLGLLLGLLISEILGLEGLTRTIVILGSTTPVGYNTLTFSSIENLDKEFAASIVSISILIAIFYIPLLIYILE